MCSPISDAPPFMLQFLRGEEVAQIAVSGDLRSPQTMLLSACLHALAERGARRLIVDLNHASFMNRAAYRPLMRSAAHLESLGATLELTGVSRAAACRPTRRHRGWAPRGRTQLDRRYCDRP